MVMCVSNVALFFNQKPFSAWKFYIFAGDMDEYDKQERKMLCFVDIRDLFFN